MITLRLLLLGAALSLAAAESLTTLERLHREALAQVAAALAVDDAAGRPMEVELTCQDAFLFHDVRAQHDPSGIRRDHAVFHAFRLRDGWTRASLGTNSPGLGQRLVVSDVDTSALAWDGQRLTGSLRATIGRRNTVRDLGEGENLHSMLKSQARPVLDWHLGGRERSHPSPHEIALEAARVPGRFEIDLEVSAFAGEARTARPPRADEVDRRDHRTISSLRPKSRRPLSLRLVAQDGRWLFAEGLTPRWNKGLHAVDASELTFTGSRLHGALVVTLQPDPWVPKDRRPRSVRCQLDLPVVHGTLAGTLEARSERGHFTSPVRGTVWQGLSGNYRIEGVDGPWQGRLTGRTRLTPATLEQLPALVPAPFASPVGPEPDQQLARALAAWRGLHAALLVANQIPVPADLELAQSLDLPLPVAADSQAQGHLLAAMVRYASAAASPGAAAIIGPASPDDHEFGPFAPSANLPDEGLATEHDQTAAQAWARLGGWRTIGPLEWRGGGAWHPALLPAVLPLTGVEWLLPRPDLNGTAAIGRSLAAAEEVDGRVRPAPEDWRGTWIRMAEMGSYQPYPAADSYRAQQNSQRHARWYAVRTLTATSPRRTWMALRCARGARLWLNGRLVWDAGPEHQSWRTAVVPVALETGGNEILVEVDMGRITYHPPPAHARSYFTAWICTAGAPRPATVVTADSTQRATHLATVGQTPAGYHADGGREVEDARPPRAWSLETGANVAWTVPLAPSAAPVVVAGDVVVATSEPQRVTVLERSTGTLRWTRALPLDTNAPATAEDGTGLEATARDLERRRRLEAEIGRLKPRLNEEDLAAQSRLAEIQAALAEPVAGVEVAAQALAKRRSGVTKGRLGPFAGACPVVTEDGIWVVFGTGIAAHFNLKGERKWQVDTGLPFTDGLTSSPCLVAGRLILRGQLPAPDKDEYRSQVLALEAATGAEAWRSSVLASPGGTVVPVPVAGTGGHQRHLLVLADGLVLDADDGRLLFTGLFDLPTPVAPVVDGSDIFFTDNRLGQARVTFWLDAAGTPCWRKRWEIRRHGSSSPQLTSAPLAHRGLLFMTRSVDENGGHHPMAANQLDVYETAYGQHLARPLGVARDTASPLDLVRAGELLVASDAGRRNWSQRKPPPTVAFLEAGERPVLLSVLAMDRQRLHAPPAVAGDDLFLRLDGELVCLRREAETGREVELTAMADNIFLEVGNPPGRAATHTAKPLAGFVPQSGHVLARLEAGLMPTNWLVAAPLPRLDEDGHPGFDPAVPARLGQVVTVGAGQARFQALEQRFLHWAKGSAKVYRSAGTFYTGSASIDFPAVVEHQASTSYYTTVLDCPRPMTAVLACRGPGITIWLGGEEIEPGTIVDFAPGYHSLAVRVDLGRLPPFGRVVLNLSFVPTPSPSQAMDRWLDKVARFRPALEEIASGIPDLRAGIACRDLLRALEESDRRPPE